MKLRGFSIIAPWGCYGKLKFLENLTREITPWSKSRVLNICVMVIKSCNYGIFVNNNQKNIFSQTTDIFILITPCFVRCLWRTFVATRVSWRMFEPFFTFAIFRLHSPSFAFIRPRSSLFAVVCPHA